MGTLAICVHIHDVKSCHGYAYSTAAGAVVSVWWNASAQQEGPSLVTHVAVGVSCGDVGWHPALAQWQRAGVLLAYRPWWERGCGWS